jgi:hypothetical protein
MEQKNVKSMIERVAEAISPSWRTMSTNDKRNARITARAAILAMREPTVEMIDRMTPELSIAENAWRVGIDMALDGGE